MRRLMPTGYKIPFFVMQRPSSSMHPHSEEFDYLRRTFDRSNSEQTLKNGSKILHIPFDSEHKSTPAAGHRLDNRDHVFQALLRYYLSQNQYSNKYIFNTLQAPDTQVDENRHFHFSLFTPDAEPARDIIILLHGLNEKSWDKYLPWARSLVALTGKSVLLFPTAFHMDRTPKAWSDPRLMSRVAKERRELFPDASEISFANAAISHRLQFAPERFLLSGLQTFHDIQKLTKKIRAGKYPQISSDASIDFFAYSIGAMLGQVLLMSDPKKLFSDSRLFMFAGGASLNLMNPVSRAIMDRNAFASINEFYGKLLDQENSASLFDTQIDAFKYFKSLLHDERMQVAVRRNRFKQIGKRIMAVPLKHDKVIPPQHVRTTGQGRHGKSLWICKTLDAPFPYSHEDPFPLSREQSLVNAQFNKVMYLAADHLGKS
ncbi:MAG: DUF6051 family protein [candidate division KSB1 bacterium]|nr:DUF6051 family protein [candidate division KSB1 bacterium]